MKNQNKEKQVSQDTNNASVNSNFKTVLTTTKKIVSLLFFIIVTDSLVAQSTLKVDPKYTNIKWLAKKIGGQHQGNVTLKDGNVIIKDGNVSGGNFIIDMTSIKCTDITDAETNKKFIGHITAGDFFEVEKYPTATLEITNVSGPTITANLTMHGITKPVSFNYTITKVKKTYKIIAQIDIDRTVYGIKYGSKNFFESIGDKAIEDIFTLDVLLAVASK